MMSDEPHVQVALSDDEHDDNNTMVPPPFDEVEDLHLHDDIPSKLVLDVPSGIGTFVEPPQTYNDSDSPSSSRYTKPSTLPRSITPTETAATIQADDFIMEVTVNEFEKRGDGIGAFVVYKVVTKCDRVPGYSDRISEVWRRFSDFLGLREKLVEKHQVKGIIIPPAPEKVFTAVSKSKAAETPASNDVAVKRARQLERFLRRVVEHAKMRSDCDVRDFLTLEVDLPHATQTSALSSAGILRMFKGVGDVFNKMAFHMEEGDRWFEQTQSHVEELEESLKKLLTLSETLYSTRKDLAHAQENIRKGLSMLASCEESTALARCLSHLAETEENAATIWAQQSEMDKIRFVECVHEYVGLISSLKDVFNERVKLWQLWQNSQQQLQKKREQKSRLELTGKADKANQIKNEIDETAMKMDQMEAEFGDLSKLIREEVSRFEVQRRHDMKQMLVSYLKSLIYTHTEILKMWQKFEPETQAIIA